MKRLIDSLILTGLLVLAPAIAWSHPYLTAEPPLEEKASWNLSHAGMLQVSYDLDRDGTVDFESWRIVKTHYFSPHSEEVIMESNPKNLVFSVSYEGDDYYYIAEKGPMFYAIDVNQDGVWDLIYRDILGDGVNGNEVLYDRPSGLEIEIPNS